MKLTQFIPRQGQTLLDADLWIRTVYAILSGSFSLADQTNSVRTFRWNSAAQNPAVTTPKSGKPLGVVVLSAALTTGSGSVVSGCATTWTWDPSLSGGAILVTAIAGLTAATDYDVTIWIVGS